MSAILCVCDVFALLSMSVSTAFNLVSLSALIFVANVWNIPVFFNCMENLRLGLMLMAVGMITVFAILLIVIYLSKLLIAIVNKVAPEEVVAKKTAPAASEPTVIDPNTLAAIKGAVNIVTGGKGKVMKVEKI